MEKIFSKLYNAYWILDVAVHCLCYFDLKKKAQFIYFSKHIKSCFETIIEIFCPKYDNQTGTKVSQLRKTYRWWFRQCLQIFCGKGCGSRTRIVCVEYPEVVLEFILKVQLVYKTPWTFRPPIYKLSIQAYYQTINVRNMNISI